MNALNLTDLLNAAGYAAIVYLLFNVFISFGSGKPLVEWINPHRRYLPVLAAALLLPAAVLLQRASMKYDASVNDLLNKLVHEDKAPPEVIGSISFVLFALTMMMLFVWCRQFLPRSPITFSQTAAKPHTEYRRAARHYISWSRQLDYVVLYEITPDGCKKVFEEALPEKAIFRRMQKVDPIRLATEASCPEEVAKQKAKWDDRAAAIIREWPTLDRLICPARQGENVQVFFDLEYGGVFIEQLIGFRTEDGEEVKLFVFAACLDEHGISSSTANSYFAKLCAAIKHVRGGSTAHYK